MLLMTQAKNRIIDAACISVDHYENKEGKTIHKLTARDASGNSEVVARYPTREKAAEVLEMLGKRFEVIWIKDVEDNKF